MATKRRSAEEAAAGQLDLLVGLHKKGVKLPEAEIRKLVDRGLLPASALDVAEEMAVDLDRHLQPLSLQLLADRHVRIVTPKTEKSEAFFSRALIFTDDEELERQVDDCLVHFGSRTTIAKADWMPDSVEHHTPEFKRWINSINADDGFFNMVHYQKFSLYVQQAQQWEREFQEQDEDNQSFRWREFDRMAENSLFAINRYVRIKESSEKGTHDFKATKAHQIVFYLLDCGYCMNVGKARQVAFTTAICAWCMIKGSLNLDFVAKYISENEDKAIRTFADKVKYPYSRLPRWARAKIKSDTHTVMYFGEKMEKGVVEGNLSVLEVIAPTKTAIASSTPTITLVDEQGLIDTVQDIRSDALPTMTGYNPTTGKQELLRQFVGWGTGGYMNSTAGQAFHAIFMADLEKWNTSDSCMFVPLVFNVWYRPGWTKEHQEAARKEAYSTTGIDAEKTQILFHQHNPECLEDIFRIGGTTLVSENYIRDAKKRIDDMGHKAEPVYGYFEPIYDTQAPAHEGSDVPFKILGAAWMPCDRLDSRCSTVMLDDRKPWRNRYYQGTDPIASDSGLSNMASVIWDAHFNTPVAVLNYRTKDYREACLQTTLLGMYYDVEGKGAVPELLEANIGGTYREYKTNKGLLKSLVYETQLPDIFQSAKASVTIGIDNKGFRNRDIVSTIKNIFLTYGHNIWIRIIFEQLEFFVEKIRGQGTVWEPADKRINKDDVLWAMAYAYICRTCFMMKQPQEIEVKKVADVTYRQKLVRKADGTLELQKVRTNKSVIRKEMVRHVA